MLKRELILNFNKNVIFKYNSSFVPKHKPVQLSDANILNNFIKKHKKIVVLIGIILLYYYDFIFISVLFV